MQMVVRWDIGMIHMDENIHVLGNHAIFAKDYNMATGNYSCINSWGSGKLAEPTINKSRIYAVDYISIVQI